MARDAEEKLRAMVWQGAAMAECQWDPGVDRLWCIELNARFWGALHHALYAGADFPRLLVDAYLGRGPEPEVPYRDGSDAGSSCPPRWAMSSRVCAIPRSVPARGSGR